jgi:hypothetical protein
MLYERGTFVECRQTLLRLLLFYHWFIYLIFMKFYRNLKHE